MEMTIDLNGRKLVETQVKKMEPTNVISTSVYDDGTEITFVQEAGNISISSNKQLVLLEDGKTVKIV